MKHIKQAIKSDQISYHGKKTREFEKVIENYVEAYVVCTNSGSSALQLAIRVLGIKNKYILCPSVTYVATANAIAHSQNTPIFIDSKTTDLTVDENKLSDYLKQKKNTWIRAMMPVWTLGYPPNLEGLLEIAKKNDLKIIEDSCQALGSFYNGQHAGTIGDIGAISFNGNKILTTGSGGALITKSRDYYELAKHLSAQARCKTEQCEHDEIGYNYRMPSLNAALGLDNWEKKESFFKQQKEMSKRNKIVWNHWKEQSKDGTPIWKPLHQLKPYMMTPRMFDMSGAKEIGEKVRIK